MNNGGDKDSLNSSNSQIMEEQYKSRDDQEKQDQLELYVKFAIEIEDSGVGISDENLKNIFVDFMKL